MSPKKEGPFFLEFGLEDIAILEVLGQEEPIGGS